MNRLQRHMFGQVAIAVSLAVALFVFVMITGSLLKEVFPKLASGVVSWGQFFEMLALTIPGVLPYALPIGLLTGVLVVLGRMSAQNEILAMKAAGLSLWRITSPIFLIAIIGVVVSALIHFEQAPRANDGYKRILTGTARTNPSRLIAPGEFAKFKNYIIYASERDDDRLTDAWLWELNDAGQVIRVVHAESASLTFVNPDGKDAPGVLRLTAHNALVETRDRRHPEDFSDTVPYVRAAQLPIIVPLDDLLAGVGGYYKKLRYYTFGELMDLRKTGWDLKPDATPGERHANRITVQLQIQSNLASALGILSMTMLAIPLGIKTSRSETLVNIAMALALALSFYVLTVSVSWIKDPAFRPDILVWLPNFLYQGIGGWLLWKAAKT